MERGEQTVLNRQDAEECEDNGWVKAQPEGTYGLIDPGRALLKKSSD